MKRDALLLFTTSFPYGSGEAFIESEISYLSKEFKRVILIPKNYYGSRNLRTLPVNVNVEKPLLFSNQLMRIIEGIFNLSPVFYFIKEFFINKVFLHPAKMFWWFVHSCDTRSLLSNKRLMKLMEENPESVLYFYWGRGTCYALPFLKHLKNPKVVRFHRIDLYDEENHLSFRKQLFESLDYAVSISDDGKKYIEKRFPEYKDKIKVCRLGTSDKGTGKSSNDGIVRILSCSGLIKRKRVDLIVKSLALLKNVKIEWTHIGDGSEKNQIISLCRRLSENVKFILNGAMPNRDVLNYYKNNPVDIFINLSNSEGIPVSVMEAMSFGIPVIATDVGATGEIVDATCGILLPSDITEEKVAEAIMSMIQTDREPLRRNARMKWEKFYNADRNFRDFVSFLSTL